MSVNEYPWMKKYSELFKGYILAFPTRLYSLQISFAVMEGFILMFYSNTAQTHFWEHTLFFKAIRENQVLLLDSLWQASDIRIVRVQTSHEGRYCMVNIMLCVDPIAQSIWGINMMVKLRALRLLPAVNPSLCFPWPSRPEIAHGEFCKRFPFMVKQPSH